MVEVSKGSKVDLTDQSYTVRIATSNSAGAVDIAAVLLTSAGVVRNDDDFIFFNNPKAQGVSLVSDESISIDLLSLPAEINRVLVTASTEAQQKQFRDVPGLAVEVRGPTQLLTFAPTGLTTETVLQVVALYRRGATWRLDAIGQGYSQGLAAFAVEHGIDVDEPASAPPTPSVPPSALPVPAAPAPGTPPAASLAVARSPPRGEFSPRPAVRWHPPELLWQHPLRPHLNPSPRSRRQGQERRLSRSRRCR